jgi:hypothetical protein
VVAGADEVVAPVRAVDDALAARLSAAIHDAPPGGSLAVALRAATSRLRARAGETDAGPAAPADWTAFRVLSR